MRLLVLFSLISVSCAYKFLVFNPLFAHSHTTFLGAIADTLTEAGHDVTVLAPILDETLTNKTGLKLTKNIVSIPQSNGLKKLMQDKDARMKNLWTTETGPLAMYDLMKKASLMAKMGCEHLFSYKTILRMLRDQKFDVAIVEPFTICGYAYAEELGIPATIGAISVVHKDYISSFIGEPLSPATVPTITVPFSDKMTIFERAKNLAAILILKKAAGIIFSGEEEFLKKRQGEKYPGAAELVARSSFLFTNSNPYLNYPKPKIHKVVDIGGIAVVSKKKYKLEEKWDNVLNERPHTVYISFGSMTKSVDMPQEYKDSLLKVCESLPNVTFIWKYEEETTMADHLPNLFLEPWLPQNALLSDSRLSVFITHGGLGSTTEVSYFGRPSIMIPIFSEQPRNAKMLARHGGSLLLDKSVLSQSEKLKEAILEVMNDKMYSQSATRLSEMLKNAPISPKELVVKHAEFAARFGKVPNLDPYGRHLSFVEYFNLDVFGCLLVALIMIIFVIYLVLRTLYRLFCSRKTKTE